MTRQGHVEGLGKRGQCLQVISASPCLSPLPLLARPAPFGSFLSHPPAWTPRTALQVLTCGVTEKPALGRLNDPEQRLATPSPGGPFHPSLGLASSSWPGEMGSGFSLPSANSEIGPASRVVWGHPGG